MNETTTTKSSPLPAINGTHGFTVFPDTYTPGDCVRCYILAETADEMAQRLAESGTSAMVRDEVTGASWTFSAE